AAPMRTATARSTTLPRRMKSRKPLIMAPSPLRIVHTRNWPSITQRGVDSGNPGAKEARLRRHGSHVFLCDASFHHAGENAVVRATERECGLCRAVGRAV